MANFNYIWNTYFIKWKFNKGSNTSTSLFTTGLFARHSWYWLNKKYFELIGFEKWLEKENKVLFNPVAEIIANQDSKVFRKDITKSKYKDIKWYSINILHKDGFSTTNQQLPSKESSTDENQGENEPKIKCLCSNEHRLMDCNEFRSKSVDKKKEFVKKECLCWNYLSKSHVSKYCISKYSCRKEDCGKKHHTLLHEE